MTWLALLPTAAMALGAVTVLFAPLNTARSGLLFLACCVFIYGLALAYHFLTNPFYCATKAFYTVGVTPGYAALAAAGFSVLDRGRVLRAAVYGALACWAVAAYAGYFVVR